MRRGDFEAAWRQTDRLEMPRRVAEAEGRSKLTSSHLLWNGRPFHGARVVVHCTHGLGDTVQFARFLPEVRRAAAHVCTLAQPPLVPLLRTTPPLGEIRDGWQEEAPEHDLAIEIMELAYALRKKGGDLSPTVPYLDTNAILSCAPKVVIPALTHKLPRVGLVWASGTWDGSRSIPARELAPLASFGGRCSFFSLQQGPEAARLCDLPLPIASLSEQTSEILHAASALLQADLLLTVDTFIAHLAGSLGRPVWLMLQHRADWRWQDDVSASPWYPTMRIFRQPRAGDWSGLMRQLVPALAALCTSTQCLDREADA